MNEQENISPHIDLTDTPVAEPGVKPVSKAVALHYDKQHDAAPRITATGRGIVAEQIIALAFAHGVKVREDADLVEVLSTLEVDSLIPLEAFAAVAEILNYVYRMNATYGKAGTHASGHRDSGSDIDRGV